MNVEPNLMNIRDICKIIMPCADEQYSEELRLQVDMLDTRWQRVVKLAHLQNESLVEGLRRSEEFISMLDHMTDWLHERYEEFVVNNKTYLTITDETQFQEYAAKLNVS